MTLNLLLSQTKKIQVIALGRSAWEMCSELKLAHCSAPFLSLEQMRQLYISSDVYLGAIGYSMWERCAMGLPSFVVPITENQFPYAAIGEELGIHRIMTVFNETPSSLECAARRMGEKSTKLEFGLEGYLSLFERARNAISS